ncbi:MAG: protein kinase, partial [Desulfobacterales bacterium]|nr:protein kinase [Desulfobacterales bacterium]
MKKINQYAICEQIHKGKRSLIYRGYCLSDQTQRVVLKILNCQHPTPQEIAQFRQEYEITQQLHDLNGVIQVYALEPYNQSLMIVMEDCGARTLTGMRLSVIECLRISIRITEILEGIHHQKLIHKDINPSNIVWNKETTQIKIIDFGIASFLSNEPINITSIQG